MKQHSGMEKVDTDDSSESDGFLGHSTPAAWKQAESGSKLRRRLLWTLSVSNMFLFLVSIVMVSYSWRSQRVLFRNEGNVLLKKIDAYCTYPQSRKKKKKKSMRLHTHKCL